MPSDSLPMHAGVLILENNDVHMKRIELKNCEKNYAFARCVFVQYCGFLTVHVFVITVS